mmetsp:Transcript_151/g.493  ORF Transcript_151/g.493 Transcript_151/m.493 type:complete len:96 (-) Transcript_151:144-431(-)
MTRFSVTSRERRAEQIYEHGSLPRARCLVLTLLFHRFRDFSSMRRFFASELGDIAALVFLSLGALLHVVLAFQSHHSICTGCLDEDMISSCALFP